MKQQSKNIWIACPFAIFLTIVLSSINIKAEILFRNTFEGSGFELTGWTVDTTSSPEVEVDRRRESQDPYQTQAHGAKSMKIKDPDSNNYANARHSVSIPDTSNEYMIEFYFWAPTNHVEFDTFPLMIPRHIGATNTTTDISIFLDQEGGTLKIQVQDADSLYPLSSNN